MTKFVYSLFLRAKRFSDIEINILSCNYCVATREIRQVKKSNIICLSCLLRYLFLDLIFSSRVLKGRRYDDALESCLKYCDGDPNFCGLASPGQIYNFVHQKVPKKLKGKDVRINGIKVSTWYNISTY